MATQEAIIKTILIERDYQDKKWGKDRKHEIPTWFLILRKELDEAEEAWLKKGDEEAIIELSQVVAVGIACMEQHGAINRFTGDKFKKAMILSDDYIDPVVSIVRPS